MWRNGIYKELCDEEIFQMWKVKGAVTLHLPVDGLETFLRFKKLNSTSFGRSPIIILYSPGTISYKWWKDQVGWTFLGNDSANQLSLLIKCLLFEHIAILNLTSLSQMCYGASHFVDHELKIIKWRAYVLRLESCVTILPVIRSIYYFTSKKMK